MNHDFLADLARLVSQAPNATRGPAADDIPGWAKPDGKAVVYSFPGGHVAFAPGAAGMPTDQDLALVQRAATLFSDGGNAILDCRAESALFAGLDYAGVCAAMDRLSRTIITVYKSVDRGSDNEGETLVSTPLLKSHAVYYVESGNGEVEPTTVELELPSFTPGHLSEAATAL